MATTVLGEVFNTSVVPQNAGNAQPPSAQYLFLLRVGRYIAICGAPGILLLGNFGNVMTMAIMRRMTSGDSAVNIYFTALAMVDLVTLDVYLLAEWAGNTFLFSLKNVNQVLCKSYTWVTSGSIPVSAWILVCLTVHRAVSVTWPHRVAVLCTRRRVWLQIIVIAVFFAGLYAHILYGFTLVYAQRYDRYFCNMRAGGYASFMDLFMYIDLVSCSLLPFLCLILANAVLVWKLKTSLREAGHSLAGGQSEASEARQQVARSVTKTVILVSVAFIVLTLPVCFCNILNYVASATGQMSAYERAEFYLVNNLSFLLMFCNSAVNFYLYCLTGKRFREEFINIITCCGRVRGCARVLPKSDDSGKKIEGRP